MSVEVRDNTDERRYEVVVDGEVAGFADYELADDRITFTHTEVSESHSGQGLAKQLVTGALDEAAGRSLAVVPVCSYVARTISRNAERYLHLVPQAARKRVPQNGS